MEAGAKVPVLVLGNKNYSSWSMRAWLLLSQFGVEFNEVRLSLGDRDFTKAVRRWSPMGKVPVLQDGDLMIHDSLAICEYVNERWLDGRGWPTDARARAVARAEAAEMHSAFSALRMQLPMNCRRKPVAYAWSRSAQEDIERVLDIWRGPRSEHGSEAGFLCGSFGIVDAMFAPVAMRFRGYAVALDATAHAYVEALTALPAMREWCSAAETESECLDDIERIGLHS